MNNQQYSKLTLNMACLAVLSLAFKSSFIITLRPRQKTSQRIPEKAVVRVDEKQCPDKKRIIMSCDGKLLQAAQKLLLSRNRMHGEIRPPNTSVDLLHEGHPLNNLRNFFRWPLRRPLLAFLGSSAQYCPHQPGTTKCLFPHKKT